MRRRSLAVILALVGGCAEQTLLDDACARCDEDAVVDDAPAPSDAPDVPTVTDVPRTPTDVTDVGSVMDVTDVTDVVSDRGAPGDGVDVAIARDAPGDVVDVAIARDAPPTGGCVSGATGTRVARFRWTGSSSGGRASVSYETNTLPDRSRWRAGAYSRSIGYTPVWGDPFLGEGGLDLSGTAFMDVELSTAGLASIRRVTLALYGRSYSTGSSGSFSWMTFDGAGAAPSASVANSAPYRWYRADATAAFRPGNGGVLLRISPGPPSGSLVVNRVELCFDAD